MTISVGTACVGDGGEVSLENWLERADQAMYAAKAAGRNLVVPRGQIDRRSKSLAFG